jgi:hypothetical protein
MTILFKIRDDDACDSASISKVRAHIRKIILDAIGQSNPKRIETIVLELCP